MQRSEGPLVASSGEVGRRAGLNPHSIVRGLEMAAVWLVLLFASSLIWAAAIAWLRRLLSD